MTTGEIRGRNAFPRVLKFPSVSSPRLRWASIIVFIVPIICGIIWNIDREQLDEIVDLIVDTVCSARKVIRIAGDDYPAEVVKSRFMKLDSSHVQYVMDCMKDNTSYVRNIKKYLLAALYNAPTTINSYYSSLVQHDMYGDGQRGRG